MDRDEVALREELVEREQGHAELLGARGCDVRVVCDDRDTESLQARGDERADAAEPDDPDRLLEELRSGERAPLPGAGGERRVRCRDVAGEAQDVTDGELGRGDDVRRRRVDDQDAGGRGGFDVDVVETDARTGDDLQAGCRGDRLGIHLGRRADEDRVGVGDRAEQRGTVRAVDVAHVEALAEGVDRGGREFFGNQDDGLGHGGRPLRTRRGRPSAYRRRVGPNDRVTAGVIRGASHRS